MEELGKKVCAQSRELQAYESEQALLDHNAKNRKNPILSLAAFAKKTKIKSKSV